jgi:hypothetical protein
VQRTIRRRTFLFTAAGVGFSWLWRSSGLWPALRPPATAIERLAGALDHQESAAVIGRAYMQAFPRETSPRVLAALLVERIPGGRGAVSAGSDTRVRELLRRAIAEDFSELEIVVLHGWVFARTEARLCALTALRDRAAASTGRSVVPSG